jgi:hypothetical protein
MKFMQEYAENETLYLDDLSDQVDKEVLNRLREAKYGVRMIVWGIRYPISFLKILWRCV